MQAFSAYADSLTVIEVSGSVTRETSHKRKHVTPAGIDPEVLKWVKTTWPDLKKVGDQESVALVLTAIKEATASDGGRWYNQTFAPYLAKQGQGGALAVLAHARAARSPAQARQAAKDFLKEALAQKGDAGPLLPWPPDNALTGKKPAPQSPTPSKPVEPQPEVNPKPAPQQPPVQPGAAPAKPSGQIVPTDGGGVLAPTQGSNVVVPPVKGEKQVDNPGQDSIDRMAALVAGSDEVQGLIGARLFQLIWDKHDDISFVSQKLRETETVEKGAKDKDGKPKLRTEIGPSVRGEMKPWVKSHPMGAVQLAQVLGVPRIPEANKDLGALHNPGADDDGKLEPKLINALRRWAVEGGSGDSQKISLTAGDLAGATGVKAPAAVEQPATDGTDYPIGPLTMAEPIKWPFAFLKDAVVQANTLLTGMKKGQATKVVNDNRRPDNVPADSGVSGNPGRGAQGAGFSREDLYGKWGDVGVVAVGTKEQMSSDPPQGRTISMRIVTEQDPKNGKLVDRLALYDISTGKVFGMTFPANFASDQPISLKAGGLDYKLKIDRASNPEGAIVLLASDGNPAVGSGRDIPTIDGLLRDRASRVADSGRVATIGGKQYYVGGQGTGDGGANVYFSKDVIDKLRDGGNASDLTPRGMAFVNENVDGLDRNKDETGKGEVRILDSNGNQFASDDGKTYHLRWNDKTRVFEPVGGAPLVLPQPAAPATPSKPGTNPAPAAGGNPTNGDAANPNPTGPATPDQNATVDSEGWPIIRDRKGSPIPYLHHPSGPMDGYPKIDVNAINRKLQDAGVGAALYQIDLGSAETAPPEAYWAVLFKNNAASSGKAIFNQGAQPLAADVIGTALWREDQASVAYMDLADNSLNEVGKLDKKATGNNIKAVLSTTDPDTGYGVLDAILQRAGFANGDRATVLGAVKRVHDQGLPKGSKFGNDDVPADIPAGAKYQIDATAADGKSSAATLVMSFPDSNNLPRLQLWPNQGMSAGAGGPNDASAIAGPGTFAYDKGTVPAGFDNWGSPMKIDGADAVLLDKDNPGQVSKPLTDAEKRAPGARLYRAEKSDGGKTTRTWYLVYTIDAPGGKQQPTTPWPVFQQPADARHSPPDFTKTKISLAGVKSEQKIGVSNQIFAELVAPYNQNSAQGVYVAKDAADGKDKHCLGVVMWWGVTPQQLASAAKSAGCK